MTWWIWLIIIILIIIGLIWFIRRRNSEDNIFESAGNRISKLGACCRKLFGGRA